MSDRESDSCQNPYRSPNRVDDDGRNAGMTPHARSRDLALAGLFLGVAYGAGTGAAITVFLAAFREFVWLAVERELLPDIDLLVMEVAAEFVGFAVLGAVLGTVSGAVLGPLQGVMTAHSTFPPRARLVRFGSFCWAIVAAIWCLLIDQALLSTEGRRWPLYVALVVAPLAAGFGGAVVASKLARARPG